MTFSHALGINNYGSSKFIVDASAANGTHTTIAAALTSASSGDTIFIRPGTYTENITLKAGVNLAAYDCDSSLNGSGHVIISGTCTMTTAGTVTMSGIQLQTNSAALLAVTGTLASVVELLDCYLNMTNNTGIIFSSSNAGASITTSNSRGNLGTTGIAIFSHSSTGNLSIRRSIFSNSGGSSIASTCSAGSVSSIGSFFANPITFSGTGKITAKYSEIDSTATNSTALTTVAGQSNELDFVRLSSGSATPYSAGGTDTVNALVLHHTNSVGISGAGTLLYSSIFQDATIGTLSPTLTGKAISAGSISFDTGANALSNYTVGTWTPTFTGSGANPTSVTYTAQVGQYIRIGALVFIHATLTVNAVTIGSASGNLQISGLPFTAKSTSNYTPILPIQIASFDLQAATKYIVAQVQNNTTNMAFIENVDNGSATVTAVTILTANTQVRVTGCYEAN